MNRAPINIIKSLVATDIVRMNGRNFSVNKHDYWFFFNLGIWGADAVKFYRNNIKADSKVLDIGAHFGSTAIYAHSLGAKSVHCIEAALSNFEILCHNIKRNVLDEKIIADNFALYAETGKLVNIGYRDERHKTECTKTFSDSGEQVQTITLEDYLTTRGVPDIIKIDIEGAEQYIGAGLELLSQFPMIKILLSMHTPFFDNKEDVANKLIPIFEKFRIIDEENKNFDIDALYREMTADCRCNWSGLRGKFFNIILQSR